MTFSHYFIDPKRYFVRKTIIEVGFFNQKLLPHNNYITNRNDWLAKLPAYYKGIYYLG